MKKKLFFALSIIMLLMLALVACKDGPIEFDGNFTMTRQIAEQILKDYDPGNNFLVTMDVGEYTIEYGYSIDGDNFVAYEKKFGGTVYYGNVGNEYYKVMIDDENNKRYTKLAKWEAKKQLMYIKEDAEFFFRFLNDDETLQDLEIYKESGSDFGNLQVTGNGYWEKQGDKIPQNAFITFSCNLLEDGEAYCFEIDYTFDNKKLTNISQRNKTVVEYVPDDVRYPDIVFISDTFNITYDRELTMPQEKGEDITPTSLNTLYYWGIETEYQSGLTRGSKIELPQPNNSAFLGWYHDDDFLYPVEGLYEVAYDDDYAAVYAKWQVPAIQTRLNGGALSASAQSKLSRCVYLSDINKVYPHKQGYIFGGWYIDEELLNRVPDDSFDLITTTTIVYAKWEPINKITLSAAGITYKLPKLAGVEGDSTYLYNIRPVKRGAVFAGWYKDSNFTTPVLLDTFPSSDATYYAKFDPAICVDINFENAALTIDLPYYINIPLTESDDYDFEDFFADITNEYLGGSSADGQGFHGWYLDSAFTQPLTSYPTGNITIYPKIAPLYYFTINAGEGTLFPIYSDTYLCIPTFKFQMSIEDFLLYAQDLVIPPDGKVFAGWYSDAALTQLYNPTQYPTANTTLYAAYIDE